MLSIEKINTENKVQVKRFVDLPYRLYKDCPQWVPPLFVDAYLPLNRKKHPFFQHSEADFFLAVRDREVVGRICAANNKLFNEYHKTKKAHFYGFESIHDLGVARALFDAVFDWARERGLDRVIGPKGLSPFDGYGMLVEGFEHRQMMNMTNYNFAYYPRLLEAMGFEKEVDFVSCYLPADSFKIPERVERIAKRVLERGDLWVKNFKGKRELVQWAPRIGYAYNKAFIHNWEYYPFTEADVKYAVDNVFLVADHRLIKLIMHKEEIVGFLFAFPDVSAALKRARGRLLPLGIVDILLEMKRTKTISGNGMGILPEFQGKGGNALLYYEMGKTVLGFNQFEHVEMTQVAETTRQMRADLKNLNGVEYKNHRVYCKQIG
ncbi:MAG TPA: GNAT family N-acetyltransferase [Anaerolineales bacterium]|nr:GNAT family N-acetyltransferase [Anaerolineales bacterium]